MIKVSDLSHFSRSGNLSQFIICRADARPQKPSRILTVHRRLDLNKEFIAKKVREESNQLEIPEVTTSLLEHDTYHIMR